MIDMLFLEFLFKKKRVQVLFDVDYICDGYI